MTISFERAGLLLHVVEKCAANPAFSSIAGIANAELRTINEEARAELADQAAKVREEEQVAKQQRLQAEAETEPTPEPVEPIEPMKRRL